MLSTPKSLQRQQELIKKSVLSNTLLSTEVKAKVFHSKSWVRKQIRYLTAGLGSKIDKLVDELLKWSTASHSSLCLCLHFSTRMEGHWGCWWKPPDRVGQSAQPRFFLNVSNVSQSKKNLKLIKG